MRKVTLVLFLPFISFYSFAQIVINEVSQGLSGSQEYVELLVTGNGQCNSCVDLRGWVIDDNNGWHVTPVGAGQGIASGCIRFKQNSFWSCVPAGTLILIYNVNDANPLITSLDNSLSDGNCKLILQVTNSDLFESNATIPNTTTTGNYGTITYAAATNWNFVGMANGDDSFQLISPGNYTSTYFSVGWGNNSLAQNIYFSGSGTGKVILMANLIDNNPFNQNNWQSVTASGNQTPGLPNNASNASWINTLNNNCVIPTAFTISASSTNINCNGVCNGTATVNVSGGVLPYTFSWSGSAAGNNTNTVNGLCAGNYQVIVSDAQGCRDTILSSQITITQPPALSLVVNGSWSTCECSCSGVALAFPSGGTPLYTINWSNGYNDQFQNGLCAGNYSVTVTDANGCVSTGNVTVGP